MGASWIRLDVTLFQNRKIQHLRSQKSGDAFVLLWIQLLCMAGQVNDGGRVYIAPKLSITASQISTLAGITEDEAATALEQYELLGMAEREDDSGHLVITGWSEHQSADKLDNMREQAAERQRRYRNRTKLSDPELDEFVERNVTVTSP